MSVDSMTKVCKTRDPLIQTSTPLPSRSIDEFNEFDFPSFFLKLWRARNFVVLCSIITALICLAYGFLQPRIYKAQAVLVPVLDDSSKLSSLASGQLGGLASLAGINVNTGGKEVTALAILRSRKFLVEFVRRHDLLVSLFATSYSPWAREHKIDPTIYDAASGQWNRERSFMGGGGPSDGEIFTFFSELVNVKQNQLNKLIEISVTWHSPVEAAEWANLLVKDINALLKKSEREQAQKSISHLRKELEKTQIVDMQQALFQLIESQLRTVMLTDVREEFAFRIIDPATVPEIRIKPNMKVMGILGGILGLLISVIFIFLKSFVDQPSLNKYVSMQSSSNNLGTDENK